MCTEFEICPKETRAKPGRPRGTAGNPIPSGEWGHWFTLSKGYLARKRVVNGKTESQYQHRLVWERENGRKLLEGETVHHKNGVTSDNRPENLELWVTRQPKGQRPDDLVEWAHEILDRYESGTAY